MGDRREHLVAAFPLAEVVAELCVPGRVLHPGSIAAVLVDVVVAMEAPESLETTQPRVFQARRCPLNGAHGMLAEHVGELEIGRRQQRNVRPIVAFALESVPARDGRSVDGETAFDTWLQQRAQFVDLLDSIVDNDRLVLGSVDSLNPVERVSRLRQRGEERAVDP